MTVQHDGFSQQLRRLKDPQFQGSPAPPCVSGTSWGQAEWVLGREEPEATSFLKNFNWRLITLHYCSGFCHTLT